MKSYEEKLRERKEKIGQAYGLNTETTLQKSNFDKTKLVQKKVQVRGKNGMIHQATRWISSDSGKAQPIDHKKHVHEDDIHGETIEEKIEGVLNSDLGNSDKARRLLSLGVLDSKEVAKMIGGSLTGFDVKQLHSQAGINSNDFVSVNESLPFSSEGAMFSNDNQIRSAISDIEEKMGSKAAFKAQKEIAKQVAEKYGLTVDKKWKNYSEDIEDLISGELGLRAVLGYGTGGVGKTYTFEKIAGMHNNDDFKSKFKLIEYDEELDMTPGGDEYDYYKVGGKGGSKAIQRAMYEHSNKLLVFDDFDSMWNDPDLINVLKNGLDTSGNGKIQWAMPLKGNKDLGEEDVPSKFTFTGKILFITNLTKQELEQKGAGPIVSSRCASTDLTMNKDQTLEHLEKIMKGIKVLGDNKEPLPDLLDTDRNTAFEAFTELSDYARSSQLNTRVLTGVIAKVRNQRRRGDEDLVEVAKQKILNQLGY